MGLGRRALLGAATAVFGTLAGCSADPFTSGESRGTFTEPATPGTVPIPTDEPAVAYTHASASGNRVLAGSGAVPDADPAVYETDGRPTWLVGLPTTDGSAWLVTTADGAVERFTVSDGSATGDGAAGTLPAGTPPLGKFVDGTVSLADRPADASPQSHPVPVGDGRALYVTAEGDLVLAGESRERTDVNALADTRIVRVADGRYALLAGPTGRYAHAVLGDAIEAERVVLADVRDRLTVETLADPDPVIEGVAPLAADLTGDGTRDVVVTLSESGQGARLAVYDAGGDRLATGPGFSTGNRWRHQLSVAPFGMGGATELAAVETPHIGGSARFYRRDGDELRVAASYSGVSTHSIGSRNLDGALAGDLDDDGSVELLVPTQSQDELLALERTTAGVDVDWRLPVGGELGSNLAGVHGRDGPLAVGAAGSDGTVRVWGH